MVEDLTKSFDEISQLLKGIKRPVSRFSVPRFDTPFGQNIMDTAEKGVQSFLNLEPVQQTVKAIQSARQTAIDVTDKIPGVEYIDKLGNVIEDVVSRTPAGKAEQGASILTGKAASVFNIDPRFAGLLVGMVRSKGEVFRLRKPTKAELAAGKVGKSVEEAYNLGHSQYINKSGELMDAGWKTAGFGKGLMETKPFNPAKRKAASGARRAREKAASYSIDDYIEVYGDKLGPELFGIHKELVEKVYRAAEEGFDVDHIASLAAGGTHHPLNLRIQNASRNRSEGARYLSDDILNLLGLAQTKADQLRMAAYPQPTPKMRQKILQQRSS